MWGLIIIIILIAVAVVMAQLLGDPKQSQKESKKVQYLYQKKKFMMTRAEHEVFDRLVHVVDDAMYVFPQVHLDEIVDHKVKGQNWKAAFRHVNQKSVDFVLCDKKYLSPVLAIELDDVTHGRADRVARDLEVERILKQAELPLVRITKTFDIEKLKDLIATKL